jgi:hypothetical protein
MTKPIKDSIEDLKYGDPLWIEFGYSIYRGKYIGNGLVKTHGYSRYIDDSGGYPRWSRRVTLWQKIKEIFKR